MKGVSWRGSWEGTGRAWEGMRTLEGPLKRSVGGVGQWRSRWRCKLVGDVAARLVQKMFLLY